VVVLTSVTDILFSKEPRLHELRDAAASAFDVGPAEVAVGLLLVLTPPPCSRVLLQRQPEDLPGDFPVWYGLALDPALIDHVPQALDAIAGDLGLAALSDAEDDEEMTLHLPDGTHHIVNLTQDDDAFRITPEIQRLIDAAGRRSSAAHPRKAIAS
jgi:hypothetical protein